MSKYLVQGSYVADGTKGLLKEGGSSRRAVIEKLISSVGGSIEGFYYAFGETDVFVIADLPETSRGRVITGRQRHGAVSIKVTVLYRRRVDASTNRMSIIARLAVSISTGSNAGRTAFESFCTERVQTSPRLTPAGARMRYELDSAI